MLEIFQGFPMSEMINRKLSLLSDTGFIDMNNNLLRIRRNAGLKSGTHIEDSLHEECPHIKDDCSDFSNDSSDEDSTLLVKPLTMENFGGVFIAMLGAYCIATTAFFAEIIWFNRQKLFLRKTNSNRIIIIKRPQRNIQSDIAQKEGRESNAH